MKAPATTRTKTATISVGATERGQRFRLTILKHSEDFLESGLAIEARITDIVFQTGLDEFLLLLSQPGDGLREVSDEPPHGNANETGKGTLCNVQVSTTQLFRRKVVPSKKIHLQAR